MLHELTADLGVDLDLNLKPRARRTQRYSTSTSSPPHLRAAPPNHCGIPTTIPPHHRQLHHLLQHHHQQHPPQCAQPPRPPSTSSSNTIDPLHHQHLHAPPPSKCRLHRNL